MKKMKRAALAMASVTAISLVGCGGSNTTTTADAQVLQKAEVKQLLNRRQQVKAAQKAEIPVIFPVTSLFPGGAEIQDMKQLKKRSRLFRQNTKV